MKLGSHHLLQPLKLLLLPLKQSKQHLFTLCPPRLQRDFQVGTSVPLKLPCQAIQQPSWKILQSNSRVVEEPLQLSDPLEFDYQPNPIGPSSGRSCSSSQRTTAAHPPGCSATMNALFRLLLLALSQNVGCEMNYKCTIHKLPYLCPSLPVKTLNP